MSRKYWSIDYFDTGASGSWVKDTDIPRAGLEGFNRIDEATITFVELADGSEAKLSSEVKSKFGDIILTFPKQIITETIKTQFKNYIDNEKAIKIHIPIVTGASSYTEQIIEGYITKYQEDWILDKKNNQRFIIKISIHEFDVD